MHPNHRIGPFDRLERHGLGRGRGFRPTLAAAMLAALFACAQAAVPAAPAPAPDPIVETLTQLMESLNREPMTWTDWAQATFLAATYFRAGTPGLPDSAKRFDTTHDPLEAMLTGLFLATHGNAAYHRKVLTALETQETKREWLRQTLGSETALQAALDRGVAWQPLVQSLPSASGYRTLSNQCMASRDPLVRRTGLYAGYYLATPDYWKAVTRVNESDPDPLTRRFAAMLLARRSEG